MKPITMTITMRIGRVALLLFVPLLLASCHSLQQKEQLLSAAGFKTVVPSSPAQSAHLKTLRQGRMTAVVKNGKTLFVLADARHNRLFVGNQQQYQSYQQLRLKNRLSQDKLATASLNADADNEWSNWGGLDTPYWGPEFNDPTTR
jgi:hypothetical protein